MDPNRPLGLVTVAGIAVGTVGALLGLRALAGNVGALATLLVCVAVVGGAVLAGGVVGADRTPYW
jgi:hypothetical protein